MAALLSQSKSLWPNSTDIPQKVLSINNASMYSDFLIKILLEWTINQHIDTQVFFLLMIVSLAICLLWSSHLYALVPHKVSNEKRIASAR